MLYKIIDCHTQIQQGKDYKEKSKNRAMARAEKLNLAYGGYRYRVKIIF